MTAMSQLTPAPVPARPAPALFGRLRQAYGSYRARRVQSVDDASGGFAVAVQRGRVRWEARALERGCEVARVAGIDERVRAGAQGVGPLRRRAQRDARHTQPIRLLLQPAGIGDDARRAGDEREHREVPERTHRLY